MSPVREEASSTHKPLVVGGQTHITVGTTHISRLTDEQLIKEFLSGSYCLHGVSMRHADWLAVEEDTRSLAIAPYWLLLIGCCCLFNSIE